MKPLLPAVVAVSALVLLTVRLVEAAPAPADGAGGPAYHLTTVSWVVATQNNLQEDDRYVTLIGHVTGRAGEEDYFFTDGTGTVRLDSGKFNLPIGPRLVIGGRIDQAYLGFGHLEVDVRQWQYAKRP
ncbi:MAG: NirD/YgiW/YdeI family stress tolerance protein [Verrucomicrobiota bacterium]